MQVSELVSSELAGKLFALIGFQSGELAPLLSALKEVGASGRTLDPLQVTSQPDLLEAFDICVLRAPRADGEPTSPPGLEVALCGKPLLAVGTWKELMRGALAVAPNRDFLLGPWQAGDFLLRSFRLLRGGNGAHKDVQRDGGGDNPLVVVVDDDATTATMVAAMLRDDGMQCSVAHDGKEGVTMVRELMPRAVLLDVNMPELNGFEVLTSIRKDPATAPIATMMLSTRQQEMDVIRGFALGADDYVAKPFNPLELVARVRRLTAC
jgi:twitching motility two-component system response regulator PilH